MRAWIGVAALAVWATLGPWDALTADRALLAAEPWRLWTGPLRHADGAHLLRDLGALLTLGLLLRGRLTNAGILPVLALGLPLPVVGALVGDPGSTGYLGLSSLAYTLGVLVLIDGARARPSAAAALGALLVAKLGWELGAGALWVPLDSGRPAVWGHLVGAALGLLLAPRVLRGPAQRPKRIRRHSTQRRISPMRPS